MSNINPNNINGSYPIAGQDNDSQGFRDNFTNILNNFNFAKSEIEDIQNKAIFKTALSGAALSNDMGGSIMANVSLKSAGLALYDFGSTSGTLAIDFNQSNFFRVTTSGSVSLALSNWPAYYGAVRVWINVTNVAHTMQLPVTVNVNTLDIAGFGANGLANTITFEATGEYIFEIASYDDGVSFNLSDLSRNRSTVSGNLSISGNIYLTGANSSIASGNTHIAGNLITGGGIINRNYFVATLANDSNLVANLSYNTYILDTASSATIANAYVTLPNIAQNGQEIAVSTLAPITSCSILGQGGTAVKWANTNIFSAGNVSAKFLYSVSAGNVWLKI
jgi:hypothetical protein